MLTVVSVLYVSSFKGDKQLSSWKCWAYLEKKVQKILNATGIFQQESIDQVLVGLLCFAMFCFVLFFSPATLSHSFYCVFLVQAFLKFNASLLCVTFMVYHQRG